MKLAPFNLFFSGSKRSRNDRVRRNATSPIRQAQSDHLSQGLNPQYGRPERSRRSEFTTGARIVRRSVRCCLLWYYSTDTMHRMVFVSGGHIRRALFITLINGLVFAWLLSPLLFGDAYINHTDAGVSDYPFMALFHSRIGETGIVWNDLSGLGFPSLFIHGFFFYPLLLFF